MSPPRDLVSREGKIRDPALRGERILYYGEREMFDILHVTPAEAGVQHVFMQRWIPAFAGMRQYCRVSDYFCSE